MPARYYDPASARFVSVDPAAPSAGDPVSLNGYSYCFGDPVNFSDPTGAISDVEAEAWNHYYTKAAPLAATPELRRATAHAQTSVVRAPRNAARSGADAGAVEAERQKANELLRGVLAENVRALTAQMLTANNTASEWAMYWHTLQVVSAVAGAGLIIVVTGGAGAYAIFGWAAAGTLAGGAAYAGATVTAVTAFASVGRWWAADPSYAGRDLGADLLFCGMDATTFALGSPAGIPYAGAVGYMSAPASLVWDYRTVRDFERQYFQ